MTSVVTASMDEALHRGQVLSTSHVLTHICKNKPLLSLAADEATVTEKSWVHRGWNVVSGNMSAQKRNT